MIKNKKKYSGAIVLGLNDALIEITGTLAGLTFAFASSKIILITGLLMGFTASMSMAASSYLQNKEDPKNNLNPFKSAIFTGTAYMVTVLILVSPYYLIGNVFYSLLLMLFFAILIIGLYTYYISTIEHISFLKRFFRMSLISLGVAFISFLIGYILRFYFYLEI